MKPKSKTLAALPHIDNCCLNDVRHFVPGVNEKEGGESPGSRFQISRKNKPPVASVVVGF